MTEIRHLENRYDVIFSAEGGPIWIKISETAAEWHVDCGAMVEIETRCRIPIWRKCGQFNGMSSQSHLPHSRVLPLGEFRVMIPELRVRLQGAATRRIQWHVIPEPRITLQAAATWWIHCHDSRATCHIAGCKNSIRHVENRFLPYFIYLFFVF